MFAVRPPAAVPIRRHCRLIGPLLEKILVQKGININASYAEQLAQLEMLVEAATKEKEEADHKWEKFVRKWEAERDAEEKAFEAAVAEDKKLKRTRQRQRREIYGDDDSDDDSDDSESSLDPDEFFDENAEDEYKDAEDEWRRIRRGDELQAAQKLMEEFKSTMPSEPARASSPPAKRRKTAVFFAGP